MVFDYGSYWAVLILYYCFFIANHVLRLIVIAIVITSLHVATLWWAVGNVRKAVDKGWWASDQAQVIMDSVDAGYLVVLYFICLCFCFGNVISGDNSSKPPSWHCNFSHYIIQQMHLKPSEKLLQFFLRRYILCLLQVVPCQFTGHSLTRGDLVSNCSPM